MKIVGNLTRVQLKMRRRKRFFRFILLLFMISLMILLALKTDIFVINDIKVIGNNKMSKDLLIKSSSINIGENIFKISVKSGVDNIKKLPYTKEIKIIRKYPKAIIIEVVERKEIIQIQDISSYITIDDEGHTLDISDIKKENIPTIVGLKIENENEGDNMFSRIKSELDMEFIKESHAIGILKKMKEINMSDTDNINIILNDGIGVAFGTLDNVIYRLSLLNEVLKDIEKKEIPCTMIIMNKGENPIIITEE